MSDAQALIDTVKYLIKGKRYEEAIGAAMEVLEDDRDNAEALLQIAAILLKQKRKGLAYNVLARVCKLAPNSPDSWYNFALSHPETPEAWGRAEWALKHSIKLYEANSLSTATAKAQLAMLYNIKGDPRRGEVLAREVLIEDPDNLIARSTLGFSYLATGKWKEAWSHYRILLDTGGREQACYGNEPEWNGVHGLNLVISGEQGLGDEIMYASVFDEVIRDSKEVTIECMPILENLFRRSFPKANVYGTRWEKELTWQHPIDAHVAMATLPAFYRNVDGDFHGKPYLVPHPEMAQATRTVLKSLGRKPKIGIAWTGGLRKTRGYLRTRALKELLPILRQDATFVSLEYNDRSEEIEEFRAQTGIEIHQFPWLTTKGLNYDLPTALISNLDLVISVPTTCVQTAGGLGVPAWVLVPKYPGWIFSRDVYPWANSVKVHRGPVKGLAKEFEEWLTTHSTI